MGAMEVLTFGFKEISFSYGKNQPILDHFSLEIPKGTVTCLIGPSGCGKTTLLHLMAGLLSAHSGTMEGFSDAVPSYIFQETRILPWKTVLGNVMFPLLKILSLRDAKEIASEYIRLVGLTNAKDQYPHQLSGGMKQRVSIARAFAFPSNLILMDEAFQGLDHNLRISILELFIDIWGKTQRTSICVTHDIDEALKLGQNIVLVKGRPLQVHENIITSSMSNEEIRSRILEGMKL